MKEILCYEFEKDIDAPIEVVFECLNEDRHVLEWNSQILEHIYDGEESELKEGSTYKTKQQIGKKIIILEAQYNIFQPPYLAEVKSKSKEGISRTKYTLSKNEYGTHFQVEVFLIPKNWFVSMMTKMFKWSFKFIYDEQFNQFVDYIYDYQYDE
ncbi:hypothetical protein AJ85_07570 [Alkalihalobacillus alcalophilus ATCC 27647 = CGMCC 1.3604]|uniref:SRPBCC family protein n=1 Tax=Alkalihalobacillus alcalophilus ATCC 27647 = CGMCC 1.3604 TaxID=1218173 RepID=A0A094YY76_ALKAL|nr:SRPBCC family protein [Alkalihalobacillus alcalophilus]KGA98492.1 hypothetical protein BALCAV_0203805 [Alkalihalobacillus alcalophilus ATCC 27647 = CGMCC 1.3604]MED1563742.1 SRPBCC family protein [Alkalihalobacillus alcalophilus]THG91048.1 hypothetical protein AJ85_07570 [Alkalihalobacillus alcalophilus ATCC 27647 = CGMCC 1.3604]